MTLLQQRNRDRASLRESERSEVRRRLRSALGELFPGRTIWVFGSLTRRGDFHAGSDVDVGVEELPDDLSHYAVTAMLEEAVRRPVDVILLGESRLRRKILDTGEPWTLSV